MNIKWCCHYFENMFGSKGHRGFSIILRDDTDNISNFLIQFRAVEGANENTIKSEKPLSLEGNITLAFCPSCGKKLSKYYRKYLLELKQNPPVVMRNQ